MKCLTSLAAALLAGLTMAELPSVSNVSMTQDADSKCVTITYDLAGEPAIVMLDVLTNGVSVGQANIRRTSGDVNRKIAVGTGKTIRWTPVVDIPNTWITDGQVKASVTAFCTNCPPDWMAVNLQTPSNVMFYACEEQLPVAITNLRWKAEWILMRRIPAAGVSWMMGSVGAPSANREDCHPVTLSDDFYLSVYQVTDAQYRDWNGNSRALTATNGLTPATLSYDALRGTRDQGIDWPDTGYAVYSGSLLASLRAKTGIQFDLPTDAQWEYACRAGTKTYYHTGSNSDSSMADYAWYEGNLSKSGVAQPVGTKLPNPWRLFDMTGNINEWCLDWCCDHLGSAYAVDPLGPRTTQHTGTYENNDRCIRGGAANQSSAFLRSSYRNYQKTNGLVGVRLWAPAGIN